MVFLYVFPIACGLGTLGIEIVARFTHFLHRSTKAVAVVEDFSTKVVAVVEFGSTVLLRLWP